MAPSNPNWLQRSEAYRIAAGPSLYRCQPIWSWNSPGRARHLLFCVLEGEGSLSLDGKPHPLVPGAAFLLRDSAHVQASQQTRAPMTLFQVGLAFPSKEASGPPPSCALYCLKLETFRQLANVASQLRFASDAQRRALHHTLSALMLLLSDPLATIDGSRYDARVHRAILAANADLARKWTVSSMARSQKLSASHFTRLFTRAVGKPPMTYLSQARALKAQELARNTSLSFEEIARRVGFEDKRSLRHHYAHFAASTPEDDRRLSEF